MGRRLPGLRLVVIAAVGLAAGQQVGHELYTLPESLLARVDRIGRLGADSGAIVPLGTSSRLLLPSSAAPYTMSRPVSLAAVDAPVCAVAVADYADQAVHVFAVPNRYRFSTFGGSRETPLFPSPASVAFAQLGRVLVADESGSVTMLDTRGFVRDTFRLPAKEPHAITQVIPGPQDELYDNWFAGRPPLSSNGWLPETPLVRIWRWRGRLLGTMGSIRTYPGKSFTQALNRGEIALSGDTLWFARYADGRLLAFSRSRPTAAPVRVVELPLYYKMMAPIEAFAASGGQIQIQNAVANHLTAFAIDPEGNFFLGQSTSWPSAGVLFRPRTILATVDRRGADHRAFDIGGEIRALAATKQLLYAVVLADRRLSVLVLRNPRFRGAGHTEACKWGLRE